MKRIWNVCLLFMAVMTLVCMGQTQPVQAMERVITLTDGDYDTDVSSYYNPWYQYEEETYFCIGDIGKIVPQYNQSWYSGAMTRKEFIVSNPAVVQVDAEGNYQVLSAGESTVTVNGYNETGVSVFAASYTFRVCGDVTATTLEKTSANIYMFESTYSWWGGTESDTTYVSLVNAPDLTYYTFTGICDNASLGVECTLDTEKKAVAIRATGEGSGNIHITLNGKTFILPVTAKKVSIKKTSAVLAKKKTTKISIKGYPGKIQWKSTNKRVASVSPQGKVKGKKVGNAVVYATIGERRLGCAVSVVTPKTKKVVTKACRIAKTCTYSQPKRMSNNYYDCSSLVWKSYKTVGKTFGNAHYAPVAADIGKWCAARKKTIKGGCSTKNVDNMKLRPGDLLFKTGNNNGRFKGIYHVEMFVGYQCHGFRGDEPILGTLWAARSENYGGSGYMMARP